MPFLTQGKTNWKYILIVVVLAVIVGGGLVGCVISYRKEITSLSKFPGIKKGEKVVEEKKPETEGETAKLLSSEVEEWKTFRNDMISHPEFKKWLTSWQPKVSVDKFVEGGVYSISSEWSEEDWYKIKSNYLSDPSFCIWENGCIYSPNKTKFIKYIIAEPDTDIYVYNIQSGKLKILASCGPACSFDTGFWLDDSRVVVCGVAIPNKYSLYCSGYDLNGYKKYYYSTPEFSESPTLQIEEFPFRAYLRKYWEEFGL